jgi:serine/threonine protein kinase
MSKPFVVVSFVVSVLFLPTHRCFSPCREAYDYHDMEYMRLDTLISERLTASPRIFSTYGLCGIASLSEYAIHGTIEEDIYGPDDEESSEEEVADSLDPYHNLSNVQKIEFALQISEAVADLHGFEGGVIMHEDIKADQFLWNEDKTLIKLNDFSRSVFMMWNDNTQEYCPYDEAEYRRVRIGPNSSFVL